MLCRQEPVPKESCEKPETRASGEKEGAEGGEREGGQVVLRLAMPRNARRRLSLGGGARRGAVSPLRPRKPSSLPSGSFLLGSVGMLWRGEEGREAGREGGVGLMGAKGHPALPEASKGAVGGACGGR